MHEAPKLPEGIEERFLAGQIDAFKSMHRAPERTVQSYDANRANAEPDNPEPVGSIYDEAADNPSQE